MAKGLHMILRRKSRRLRESPTDEEETGNAANRIPDMAQNLLHKTKAKAKADTGTGEAERRKPTG